MKIFIIKIPPKNNFIKIFKGTEFTLLQEKICLLIWINKFNLNNRNDIKYV